MFKQVNRSNFQQLLRTYHMLDGLDGWAFGDFFLIDNGEIIGWIPNSEMHKVSVHDTR